MNNDKYLMEELVDNSIKNHIIHFTHNDSDAVGCNVLLKLIFKDELTTYYSSASNIDDTINKFIEGLEDYNATISHVFITDINPTKETINALIKAVSNLNKSSEVFLHIDNPDTNVYCKFIGIDHHVTNNLNETFDWFHINASKVIHGTNDTEYSRLVSATYNLYWYLHDHYYDSILDKKSVKNMVSDISDYDTWEWKTDYKLFTDHREDAVQVLTRIYGAYETSNILYSSILNTDDYILPEFNIVYETEIFKNYNSVKYSIDKTIIIDNLTFSYAVSAIKENEELRNIFMANDIQCNFNIALYVLDGSVNINEVATFMYDYLYKKELNNGLVCIVYSQSRTLSFRSNGKFDCSRLAKAFGGGGHKAAAGSRIKSDTMLDILKVYYENIDYGYTKTIKDNITVINALNNYIKSMPAQNTFEYNTTFYHK